MEWGEDKGVLMRSFAKQYAYRKAHAPGSSPTNYHARTSRTLKAWWSNIIRHHSPAEDWRMANQMRTVNNIPETNPGAMAGDNEDDHHLLEARTIVESLNQESPMMKVKMTIKDKIEHLLVADTNSCHSYYDRVHVCLG